MKERIKRLERSARRLQMKAAAREEKITLTAVWGNDSKTLEPDKPGEIHLYPKWGKDENEN